MMYAHGSQERSKSHLAYNVGRLNSYILLGALAGGLGRSLNLVATAVGVGQVAGVVFGGFLLLWGLHVVVMGRGAERQLPGMAWVQNVYRKLGSESIGLSPVARAYALGLLSTLLPCGWLYTFGAVAAASGSVLGGVLVMSFFWAGTLPYLLGVGVASQLILPRMRKHLSFLTGVFIALAGVLSIAQHYRAFSMAHLFAPKEEQYSSPSCH
jgi:sulfite exporter TauE/SafE